MKRIILNTLLLIVALAILLPASAQDEERFDWEPFDFSIQVPDGWQATAEETRLYLLPEGIDNLDAAGPSIVIEIIETDRDSERTLRNHSYAVRSTIEDRRFGDQIWPAVTDVPITSGKRTLLILVHETFLVSATAPEEQWESFDTILTETVVSIEAQPTPIPLEMRLTQYIAWRGLSFYAPEDFLLASAGVNFGYIVTTQEARLNFGSTFLYDALMIDMIDLSPIRASLSTDSLPLVKGIFYRPEDVMAGTINVETSNSVTIASALIDGGETMRGKILLILTPQDAYFLAGYTGPEQWIAGEGELFEAILTTLEVE